MIALDVETSGLSPERHSILSLGAVDLDDPNNTFYEECRIWEGAQVSDEALAINGFSREELSSAGKGSEADLMRSFIAWATDRPQNWTLIAQNVSFDHDFVAAACRRAGLENPFPKRTLDIHTLAWLHMTLRGEEPPAEHHHSKLSSSVILRYCGLPEEAKPHNALTGARWHAEAFSRMAYNKKILHEFLAHDIPWTN